MDKMRFDAIRFDSIRFDAMAKRTLRNLRKQRGMCDGITTEHAPRYKRALAHGLSQLRTSI